MQLGQCAMQAGKFPAQLLHVSASKLVLLLGAYTSIMNVKLAHARHDEQSSAYAICM
jgi:hypothetical protein